MNLYWIIGLLVLWSGVITAGDTTAAPEVGTKISYEFSAFMISIKITNQIYNESLEDHHSQSYKVLRREVENVFSEIYNFTSAVEYQKIAEMTFSNGSVIANSTVIFGTKQESGEKVKQVFVNNYEHHHSLLTLDLNINYTADQEPIPVQLPFLTNISDSTTAMTTSPTSTEHHQDGNEKSAISTTSASTSSGQSKSIDDNSSTTPPQTYSTTHSHGFTNSTSQTTSDSRSMEVLSSAFVSSTTDTSLSTIFPASSSTMTVRPSSNISTMSATSSSTTTVHPSSNRSTISATRSSTTTVHPSSNRSTMSTTRSSTTTVHPSSNRSTMSTTRSSTTTVHPSSNISTMSASSSSTTTVHPSSNISTMSASSSSESVGKTVTQNPTEPEGSHTVETEQGVPGWGIAILVLAAIILFFMLVLLILLLLFWCCWWKQRGFMNVSDPDPMGYYNPDIPMYSTHSTYDSHNGKSLNLN
ncbi:hypothetical protein KOW79_000640 [Hemibagrus wyckioides]|uniref:Mucin-1 n=2 Tax=Hemibagrus wyckioides TaxID=337641 RepID=A0A9D3STB3_9TELE|nr:hypothetical protein KOW79_000640 [Hemibagrus wyckioides]